MAQPLELADLVPGTHLGHYVITDRLAQGGMGTVFRAMEPTLERYVAIKVLRPEYASNPDYVQYFQEEARAVAALRHPNIVPIFYIGQEGNVVFFSMAYIDGETFDDWIETKRWFTEEHAKWFLSHAIAALHSAHKSNIVHLDIKPANFLVDRGNHSMLNDLGVARRIVKGAGGAVHREAFGTPAYVSPEQITRGKTDQRTDIYSLGATLFHLFTGRVPFEGRDRARLVLEILADIRVGGVFGPQNLDRDVALQRRLERPEDRAHPALRNPVGNDVMAEVTPGYEVS